MCVGLNPTLWDGKNRLLHRATPTNPRWAQTLVNYLRSLNADILKKNDAFKKLEENEVFRPGIEPNQSEL